MFPNVIAPYRDCQLERNPKPLTPFFFFNLTYALLEYVSAATLYFSQPEIAFI